MNPEFLLNVLETGLSVGVIGVDSRLRVFSWNRWMEKNTGMPAKDVLGKDLPALFPDIRKRGKDAHIISCIKTRRPVLLSPLLHHYLIPITVTKHREKMRMYQHARIFPVNEGDTDGAVILIEDMTEPILHDREVQRLNAILKGLKNINASIAESQDEADLCERICQALIRDTDYLCAMIGNVGNGEVYESAFAREGPLCEMENATHFSGGNFNLLTPILSRTKSQVILEQNQYGQVLSHCASCPLGEQGKSMAVFPVFDGKRIVGILSIASHFQFRHQRDELELLATISKDLSFGLESILGRKKYHRTKENLKESRAKVARMREKERTEALLKEKQAQIVHSGRLALLGEMGTGIAHEINQPLTIIRLSAEKLLFNMRKASGIPSEYEENLNYIIRSVDRASGIISHMREFARKDPERREMANPGDLVESALSFFNEQFRNHQITLVIDIAPGMPSIRTDAKQIEQVLVNLLSNAKYAVDKKGDEKPEGYKKRVDVKAYFNTDEKNVIFEVADNGMGMTPDEIESCRDPFFTTKEVGDGTGLGLYVVHGIVRNFNGKIEIESEKGDGAVFRILLPADSDDKPKKDDPYVDVGRELSNIGIGEAADALSKLMKKRVFILRTEVHVSDGPDAKEMLARNYPSGFIAVSQNFSGPFEGKGLLCFSNESFMAMLEEISENHTEPGSQMEILGEIGNILIGSFMTAIGGTVEKRVLFEMPRPHLDFSGHDVDLLLPKTGTLIEWENQIAIHEINLTAHLLVFIKSGDYETIAEALLNRIKPLM